MVNFEWDYANEQHIVKNCMYKYSTGTIQIYRKIDKTYIIGRENKLTALLIYL